MWLSDESGTGFGTKSGTSGTFGLLIGTGYKQNYISFIHSISKLSMVFNLEFKPLILKKLE